MHPSRQTYGGVFGRLLSMLGVCLMLASIFGSPATAAPFSDALEPGRKLFARGACPSLDELTKSVKSRGAGLNTVFYTKPATSNQADRFKTTLNPKGKAWNDLVRDPDDLDAWFAQCNEGGYNGAEQDKLLIRVSRSIAEAAKGTAYVLISPDADPRAGGSVFTKHEFPTLMRNGAVDKVIGVNPDDIGSPTQRRTIWKRGDPVDLPESTA